MVSGQVIFDNIQLEEGSTATNWVPYLNLEEAMPKLKVINVGKSNYVRQGNISTIQLGNIVIVEVSALFVSENREEWATFIGYGLPKPYLPGGGFVKGVLADNKGVITIDDVGNLHVSERTNTQLSTNEYNGKIVYVTLD